MRNFIKSVKFKIAMSVLAALLLGVFVAAVSTGRTTPLTSALNFVLTPLNSLSEQLKETLTGFFGGIRSAAYYKEQLDAMQEELDGYREQLVDHEKLQQKLSSYEAFLEIKSENDDFAFAPATVILRDAADPYGSFTLNKGTLDGLDVNMPVIYGKNLVGVIREVSPTTALVYTLFHPDMSVSAYEIRTREDCYTQAENALTQEGSLKLMGLTRTTPVVSGGMICTSGIGGIYPRDLIIGSVTQVVNSEADISAYALVKPAVDPGSVMDVFVITGFEDDRP